MGLLPAAVVAITAVSLVLGWGLLAFSEASRQVTGDVGPAPAARPTTASARPGVPLPWPVAAPARPAPRTLAPVPAPPRRRREAVSGQVPQVRAGAPLAAR